MANSNDLILEKEFEKCKRLHMISICMSALVYDLELEAQEGVNIPTFLIRDKIENEAVKIIEGSVKANKFTELYRDSWSRVQEVAPELYN